MMATTVNHGPQDHAATTTAVIPGTLRSSTCLACSVQQVKAAWQEPQDAGFVHTLAGRPIEEHSIIGAQL